MANSSAAGWLWHTAFSSCYPQTRRHVRGVEQRPHPTKHKDLLLYCSSTVKASSAHPHFPGAPTRAGWRRGRSTANQSGFVVFRHPAHTLCSNCCCQQFHCWGVSQPPCRCSDPRPQAPGLLPTKPSSVLRAELVGPFAPPLPHLDDYKPLHLFLEVQKLFVDTHADRSTPSTSFSSSSHPIQASTLRRFCHATKRPWQGWSGAGCASGESLEPRFTSSHFFLTQELSCSRLVCVCCVLSTVTKDAVAADSSFSYADISERAV